MKKALAVLKSESLIAIAMLAMVVGIYNILDLSFWVDAGRIIPMDDGIIVGPETEGYAWWIYWSFGGDVFFMRLKVLIGIGITLVGVMALIIDTLKHRTKRKNPKGRAKDVIHTLSLVGGIASIAGMAALTALALAITAEWELTVPLVALITSLVVTGACIVRIRYLEKKVNLT